MVTIRPVKYICLNCGYYIVRVSDMPPVDNLRCVACQQGVMLSDEANLERGEE